jgi:glycosyltransferase involved in cell wall biosynthesis
MSYVKVLDSLLSSIANPPLSLNNAVILQVVPGLDTGGVEQTVIDMAQAIIQNGGKAIVVSNGGRREPELTALGALSILLPVHSKNPFVQWQNRGRLRKLIKDYQVDIIHVRSRAPAYAAIMAARDEKIISLSTYHGIYNARSSLKRAYNGLMTKAWRIIANSDYTRAHILGLYDLNPNHVITINRGVDLSRFDPEKISHDQVMAMKEEFGITAQITSFLLAGRLTRWKGHTLIIKAAHLLKSKGIDNFRIIMVGDDQGRRAYREELETMIETLGLKSQILLLGHCSSMPSAYLACDFAINASTDPEAFGRTAVEPQIMGRPVLASDHGAPSESVLEGKTGFLVPPGDVDAWAEALLKALGLKHDEREQMGQAAKKHGRLNYSLKAMCDSTIALYDELLKVKTLGHRL